MLNILLINFYDLLCTWICIHFRDLQGRLPCRCELCLALLQCFQTWSITHFLPCLRIHPIQFRQLPYKKTYAFWPTLCSPTVDGEPPAIFNIPKKHSLSLSIPRKLITLPVYELFFLRNVTPKPANADFPPSVGDARPPPSFGNGCVQHSLPRPRPSEAPRWRSKWGRGDGVGCVSMSFGKYMILDIELRKSNQMITWSTSQFNTNPN